MTHSEREPSPGQIESITATHPKATAVSHFPSNGFFFFQSVLWLGQTALLMTLNVSPGNLVLIVEYCFIDHLLLN